MSGSADDQGRFAAETRFANIFRRLSRAKIDGYVSRRNRIIERTSEITFRCNREIRGVLNGSANRLSHPPIGAQ
jgi:hypothetical protein